MGLLIFTIFLIGCMSLGKAAEVVEVYENQFDLPNEDAEDIPTKESRYQIQSFDDDESPKVTMSHPTVESQYQIQSFDDDESPKVTMSQTSHTTNSFTLVLCPGQKDYANCAGKYVRSAVTRIRGRPVYFNKAKQRFIFYVGGRWVITSNGYLLTVARDGATGGFYKSHSSNLYHHWYPRYTIKHHV